MILDKNGKLFGKFSVIDFAVILLVAVFAVGIWIRLNGDASETVKKDASFTYMIEVENVRTYTVEALRRKGEVTDTKGEKVIGEIVDVQTEKAMFQSVTASGDVVEAALPERFNCIVTIRSDGKESEDGYFLEDNTELSVGRMFDILSKYVQTSGMITEIEAS